MLSKKYDEMEVKLQTREQDEDVFENNIRNKNSK